MIKPNDESFSRRKWLRFASISSLGSGLLAAATGVAAKVREHPTSTDPNLGARIYNVSDFGAKGDGSFEFSLTGTRPRRGHRLLCLRRSIYRPST